MWPVIDRLESKSQLEHSILNGLEQNTREVLATATDFVVGTGHEERLLEGADQFEASHPSGVMERVFYAGREEKEGEENESTGVYFDIEEQTWTKWEQVFSNDLNEAEVVVIFNNGWNELESYQCQYCEAAQKGIAEKKQRWRAYLNCS